MNRKDDATPKSMALVINTQLASLFYYALACEGIDILRGFALHFNHKL